jgi:predicted dehydrogenase
VQNISEHQFIILGLGSIGKHHAEFLSSYKGELVCIDPNIAARNWIQDNFELDKAMAFSSLQEAEEQILLSPLKKIGVISNWGTQHFQSILDFKGLNIKNLYVEKPIANSLSALNSIKDMTDQLNLIGGFQYRYIDIIERVHQISLDELGGLPTMMTVNGGAAGMVTNGVHFLDLSISIFGADPLSVVSNLSSSNINPRSKELDFWEGLASWEFSDNRHLTINFTNQSSVERTAEIFCPKGKIKINEDMSLDIFQRSESEILADNRIIRLGTVTQKNSNSIEPNNDQLFSRIFFPLLQDDKDGFNIDRELSATKAMIYALIASKTERKVSLLEKPEESWYEYEWQIS